MHPRYAESLLAASFFISGAAALTYQICWNRALYGAIGIDTDSTTIIVSCFMLGIGIGGALGGLLADRMPRAKVRLYAAAETSLCVYGLVSLSIISAVSTWTLIPGGWGMALTAIAAFVALLFPTILMGMTLPLLSLAFEERLGNMGSVVGRLYGANTLGAAVGAFATPYYLFSVLDLHQVCMLAAALNIIVAIITLSVMHAFKTFPINKSSVINQEVKV
jgi:MFS family permease